MKVIVNDELNTIIFLNKMVIENIDFIDKEEAEDYFRQLFLKLKERYNIIINGYYILNLYIDEYYGMIIELKKEEMDYFDYYDNQIDMKIIINNETNFLYEIDDILSLNTNNFLIYKYNKKYYLQIKNSISEIEMGKILEYSTIIYNEDVDDIMKYGKLVINI